MFTMCFIKSSVNVSKACNNKLGEKQFFLISLLSKKRDVQKKDLQENVLFLLSRDSFKKSSRREAPLLKEVGGTGDRGVPAPDRRLCKK